MKDKISLTDLLVFKTYLYLLNVTTKMKFLNKIILCFFLISIFSSCQNEDDIVASDSHLAKLNTLLKGRSGITFQPINATEFKFSFNSSEVREQVLKQIEFLFSDQVKYKEFEREILNKIDENGLNVLGSERNCLESWTYKLLYSDKIKEFYSQVCVTITCTGSNGFNEVICYESLDENN